MAGDGPEAIIFIDGASRGNPGPAGAGVVIQTPQGDVLREIAVPIPQATNNVAEYTGLLEGLRAAEALGLKRIEVRTDSELLHHQLKGLYRVKNPTLQRLFVEAMGRVRRFESFAIRHIRREGNVLADKLASAAARQAAQPSRRPAPRETLDL